MSSMESAARTHNKDLRRQIVRLVYDAHDGHIPSALSIVDILDVLYGEFLRYDPRRPASEERDYFILSKGHGCVALYVVLRKYGFLDDDDLAGFCRKGGRLGEHPDCTQVPGVEASTGSLGHGLSFAVGLALGLRLRSRANRVVVLVGDGECHEGTVWEAANVARNLELGNLAVLVDWNGSAAQLMPHDDLPAKWRAFGWETLVIDGHDPAAIRKSLLGVRFTARGVPSALIAKTVKGKGIPMIEGHGPWHHRIPGAEELRSMMEALS